MNKQLFKKVVDGSWIYGAFFGFMPPYVFTLIVVATVPEFRLVYYLRLLLAIVIGALVGGYSTSIAVKTALKVVKKTNIVISVVLGFILGAICGAVTLAATSSVLMISSTDLVWAVDMLIRSSLIGVVMGGVAGVFFGAMANHYLKK